MASGESELESWTIAQIADVHPSAAQVLADGVTTGSVCRYDGAVVWEVG